MSARFRDVMMEARISRYVANDPKPSLFRCWVRAFVGRFKWNGSRPRVASPVGASGGGAHRGGSSGWNLTLGARV
jgi:hypothetical protein